MTTITWQNKGALQQQQISNAEILMRYSADYINSLLARPIVWEISVNIDPSIPTANGSSDVKYWYKFGDKNLFPSVGAYQSITGVELTGFESKININPKYLTDYFVDTTPSTVDDVPSTTTDTLGTFLHEMLHSLAFNGWTNWTTIINSDTGASPFDTNIVNTNGKPYFNGENAKLLYGSKIPLSPGNLFHVGNSEDGAALSRDLMQGFTYNSPGPRRTISELDLAMLADYGIGTIRNDILNGSPLDDNIAAGKGNDVIRASIGNDKIDGGDDLDYVTFSGNASNFSISNASNGTVTVTNSSYGTDMLNNVERVRFTDKVIAFDTTGNAGQAFRMYKAALDRTPDERGLAGWIKFMDDGGALKNMAQQFIDSQEFRTKYGALDNTNFINQLYKNVLARNGEPSGISGWVNGLANGLTRADVLKGFSESGENQTNVAKLIGNGISYTEWWLT